MRITKTAQKQLRKMASKDANRLVKALENFEVTGNGDVKKLQGREGYRLRVGNMRAIFTIVDGVLVLEVGYRGNIYER